MKSSSLMPSAIDHFFAVGDDLVDDLPARKALEVGEQRRLAEPVVRLPADGGDVFVRIRLLSDPDQLALLFEVRYVGSQRLVAHFVSSRGARPLPLPATARLTLGG